MAKKFIPDQEIVEGIANSYGISNEDAADIATLNAIESHLIRQGDSATALLGVVHLLQLRINRRVRAVGRALTEEMSRENYNRNWTEPDD